MTNRSPPHFSPPANRPATRSGACRSGAGYREMLKSDVADLNNAPEGGFAGSVTAALFLEKFVPDDLAWAHFDTFAWMPSAKPGRPKGGEALGLRAAWTMLRRRYTAG